MASSTFYCSHLYCLNMSSFTQHWIHLSCFHRLNRKKSAAEHKFVHHFVHHHLYANNVKYYISIVNTRFDTWDDAAEKWLFALLLHQSQWDISNPSSLCVSLTLSIGKFCKSVCTSVDMPFNAASNVIFNDSLMTF